MTKVICFGDSLVDGSSYLTKTLCMRLSEKWRGVDVINLGVAGTDTVYQITNQQPKMAQYKPSLVIFQTGTNDITGGSDNAATICARMASLYEYCKTTLHADVWAMTCVPSEWELTKGTSTLGNLSARQPVRTAVNSWIRAQPDNVDLVIDAWTLLRDLADPVMFNPAYRFTGWGPPEDTNISNHWNDVGLQLVIDQLIPD